MRAMIEVMNTMSPRLGSERGGVGIMNAKFEVDMTITSKVRDMERNLEVWKRLKNMQ